MTEETNEKKGKLFVYWDENKQESRMMVARVYPENYPPAIVYPVELTEVTREWLASATPEGVAVENPIKPRWSLVAIREEDNKTRFYLRDIHGIIEEIKWGHCHHAIFHEDWDTYFAAVKNFREDLKKYEEEKDNFTKKIKTSHVEIGISDEEAKNMISLFDLYWANNMELWVRNYHPEVRGLNWAIARLEEAKKELAEYKEKIRTEYPQGN